MLPLIGQLWKMYVINMHKIYNLLYIYSFFFTFLILFFYLFVYNFYFIICINLNLFIYLLTVFYTFSKHFHRPPSSCPRVPGPQFENLQGKVMYFINEVLIMEYSFLSLSFPPTLFCTKYMHYLMESSFQK